MASLSASLKLARLGFPLAGHGAPDVLPTKLSLWLVGTFVWIVLPHLPRLPFWSLACLLGLIAWRLLAEFKQWPLPDRQRPQLEGIKHFLSITIFFGLLAEFQGQMGLQAGTVLIILMLALKLLELKQIRDYYVFCMTSLVLVATQFFASQSIPTAAYMLVAVWLIIANLIALNAGTGVIPVKQRLRWSAQALVQAVPIMLIAFVLFPRIQGSLWGHQLTNSQHSGLSDNMTPGMFSALGMSQEIVFRVKFKGAIPPRKDRYWRGPVLSQTDGRTWRTGPRLPGAPLPIAVRGTPYDYMVTLEPHHQHWLFALEMPLNLSADETTLDYQWLRREPVTETINYSVRSYADYRFEEANRYVLLHALALPPGAHPKTVALAQQWREELHDPTAIMERWLRMIHDEAFYYTLSPSILDGDNVDDFLFGTRRGFCEHYAGAFTVFMRAAGIPARVVTGYYGGSVNPIGDYLVVRQSDAHAWAEIWVQDKGWIRIDPTSAIALERIEKTALAQDQRLYESEDLNMPTDGLENGLGQTLRNAMDAVNYQWNQWVIGFDAKRQLQVLTNLGLSGLDLLQQVLLMFVISAMALAIAAWKLFQSGQSSRDPLRILYDRYCRKLSRIGIVRHASEGPLAYAERALRLRPDLAESIVAITREYIRLRYGQGGTHPQSLSRAIQAFHPVKKFSG